MTRVLRAPIDEVLGLSDRRLPAALRERRRAFECPDLLNVEFSERVPGRRLGFRREHTNVLRKASIRQDGVNDVIAINHIAAYQPAARLYAAGAIVLRSFPTAAVTVAQKGFGTGANLFLSVQYDPTINTNAGGWRFRAWDATAAALRNVTINDGDGTLFPVGTPRFWEVVYSGTGNDYTCIVRDAGGATVGAVTMTVQTWATSTSRWTLGVGETAAGVLGTDYVAASVAEFKLGDQATAPSAAGIVGRELKPTELTGIIGYWRLNDGFGAVARDEFLNHGYALTEGIEWVGQEAPVVGVGGLRFIGGRGVLRVDAARWFSAMFNDTSGGGSDNYRSWSHFMCFTPELQAGQATIPDQTLFWYGLNMTNPQPAGLRIVGGNLIFAYQDAASTQTRQINGIQTLGGISRIGQRLRIITTYSEAGGQGAISIQVITEEGALFGAGVTNTVLPNPLAISSILTIGNRITSIAPVTPNENSCVGIISDFYVVDRVSYLGAATVGAPYPFNPSNAFTQLPASGVLAPSTAAGTDVLVFGMYLDDGAGRYPATIGQATQPLPNAAPVIYAFLYPEEDDGVVWDVGLVDPYVAPQVRWIGDYRRIDGQGNVVRERALVAHSTLYTVAGGIATPRAGNLQLGGNYNAAQYGSQLVLAAQNRRRPSRFDGRSIYALGIRAPFDAPSITTNGAGGTLAAGLYSVYVVFYNQETDIESNPSPVATFTAGTSTTQITQIILPRSADPQVTGRRVYMTVANGPYGSTAYLIADVADNITTTWGVAVTALNLLARTMSYIGNEEAPPSSVVTVYRDRVVLGGHPMFPTRIYWSDAGRIGSFDSENSFVDADTESGDVVVGLRPLQNRIRVYLRDARRFLQPVNNPLSPFDISDAQEGRGAVSANAITALDNLHFFLDERSLLADDGYSVADLSSPNSEEYPSIEHTMRQEITPAGRMLASIAYHRSRNQLFLCFPEDGVILVYSYDQRRWSVYDVPADFVTEIEDDNDEPWIFAAVEGFLVRLDTGRWDGHDLPVATVAGSVTSGTTTSLVDSAKTWTVDQFRGMRCYWYRAADGITRAFVIAENTATTLVPYGTLPFAPAVGDGFIIGGLLFYFDVMVDFRDEHREKRLLWVRVRGTSDSDQNRLRLTVIPNSLGRNIVGTPANYVVLWPSTQTNLLIPVGGIGRTFRMRFSEASIDTVAGTDPVPSLTGSITLMGMEVEAVETDAR